MCAHEQQDVKNLLKNEDAYWQLDMIFPRMNASDHSKKNWNKLGGDI
jgi:hypothetical protein